MHSFLGCFSASEFEKQSLALIDLVMSSILSNDMLTTVHLIYDKSLILTKITERIKINRSFVALSSWIDHVLSSTGI